NATSGDLDWSGVHAGKGQRTITLPTYPFNRQRFWISAGPHGTTNPHGTTSKNIENETKRHRNHG
ncbi:hypothetical protein ABT236_02830, partial [Streptomyces sp. NPDC001523]|uniref:hypothetical protein n=1 Tax=Streptomyces sp. NPDC001523 TaxID=3154383 RepID=UPI0033200A7F